MKTYEQLMLEVMSMSDMKKVPGGTDKQRQIAQQRQKAREAKNKGFDDKKAVINNKPSTPKPTSSDVTKTNPNAIQKSGALVKTDPKKTPPAPGGKMVPQKPGAMKKTPSSAMVKKEKQPSSIVKTGKQNDASGSAGDPKLKRPFKMPQKVKDVAMRVAKETEKAFRRQKIGKKYEPGVNKAGDLGGPARRTNPKM